MYPCFLVSCSADMLIKLWDFQGYECIRTLHGKEAFIFLICYLLPSVFYGYWLLTTNEIKDLCVSWCKALRQVWCLPNTSHSYFLPILSQCLPLFDEICRHSINFIRSCLSNESSLFRHISQYAVLHG